MTPERRTMIERDIELLDAMRCVYPGDPDNAILRDINRLRKSIGLIPIIPVEVTVTYSEGFPS